MRQVRRVGSGSSVYVTGGGVGAPRCGTNARGKMKASTPILCRVCKKKLGVVRDFEGKVFTLCLACEKVLKAAKRRRKP